MIKGFLILVIFGISAGMAVANVCTDAGYSTVNGFISHETNCSNYYSCYAGTPYEFACPAGFYFNPDIQKCDPKYVCVVNNCPATGVTRLAVNGSCTQYILCIGGVQYAKECQTDLAYDASSTECVPAAELQCTENQCDSTVAAPQMYVNAYNCMKYYICDENYSPIEFECATGTIFDATTNKCILGTCPTS
ncbi:uncharacterized protein LOC134226260 [Armigeres subalbatus]|uniref:uncharacterized protein LOC134226260 n=1 Tax=Armigeres subalbatus TaxID=124917 RepID=UPI002ED091B5